MGLFITWLLVITRWLDPYLGDVQKNIQVPRLKTPREKITAGSVGIADKQTGIYSIDSPGGWRIIGRTPIRLFDPESENPILLKPGNYLKFAPIDKTEFEQIRKGIQLKKYQVKSYIKRT